ncbi:hypothetical protein EYC80_002497 [Monilinia laxa]|uniref:Uncharacterized protein n=1 Tax=Monilinia laxa TaxID=61186 RepID=A0A5N6K400_MONLA|nr:hypothetical protein EYC80_002497 [Monilinia laxa]
MLLRLFVERLPRRFCWLKPYSTIECSRFFNSVQSSFLSLFSFWFFSLLCLLWSVLISHLTLHPFTIARSSHSKPSFHFSRPISPRSIYIFYLYQ